MRCVVAERGAHGSMVFYRLVGFLLIVTPWKPVMAFRTRVVLTQKQRSTRSYHLQHNHDKRIATTCTTTVITASTTTSATTVTTAENHSPKGVRMAAAGGLGASHTTLAACSERTTSCLEQIKCGANFEALTRSRAIASLLSASMAAAGLALGPRHAAAQIAEREPSVGSVAEVLGEEELGSVEETKYVVGVDEVGVLFGDGPIGLKLGDNPLKASGVCRVYVTEVLQASQAVRKSDLRAGFGVAAVAGIPAEKLEPKEVAEIIRVSPRPLEIVFRDPELLGRRLQAEADKKAEAARRSKQRAADEAAAPATPASKDNPGELRVTQVGGKPTVCGTRTKAGDLIEFRYSARLASDLSVEFDSSDRRGTGLPYAIVLGNGDVLKGLDLSLFDMCVGERRKIEIPARLAYGRKGSKAFGVPPDDGRGSADVVFGVELVSINFRSDASDQRDNFYTDDPCDPAAVAAGNASGLCPK